MKTPFSKFLLPGALAISVAMFVGSSHAADKDDAAKMSVKDIMKKAHKGDDALVKKVAKGDGSKEEILGLLAMYQSMVVQKPEKGDEASWKEKTTALVSATEKLSKDPSAVADFKKAINCKACHMNHKPD